MNNNLIYDNNDNDKIKQTFGFKTNSSSFYVNETKNNLNTNNTKNTNNNKYDDYYDDYYIFEEYEQYYDF